ncbi:MULTISPECIES: S8 family serine peptidase [unclassified Nostoc]|uniref:S8 family serine peptidase n=1 Tax=unclassified Nostoc TaxID=2593658 RepID=UPI002AD3F267|nr:S8 family serine peptidase [Nostoc sp. DedQUE03]MDZ7972528.1 S8 family serine peptidase [Nostoc sp. DedQUE03]MDZ8044728.1 S8 family serine peptidase [Nostoc sp. DedQUE02]
MVEGSQGFPHIELRLTTEGRAASPPGGGKKNPITVVNLGNRQGHGGKLKGSVDSLIFEWQETQEEREQEEKPPLKSRRIILEIDPDSFNPDGLKAYGIELIADTEDGYIIGASADLELSELQEKIEKFINEQYGGNKVAEIWEVIDGKKKPELILSPNLFTELYEKWLVIKEEQIYTVDVGVACVGTKTKLPNYPKLQPHETNENFTKRVNNWIQKRQLTEQEWEEISWERQDEFEEFIQFYKGKIIKGFQDDGGELGTATLPDSFSCRIQISGKGLKDLVENFPYIFDVSEPDEFAEIIQRQDLSDINSPSFQLESPELNAPRVCVIDSGIQERHSLLKAAIDSKNSRSWVPGETDKTPDYVSNGGHGTSVAGAILYPRTIPRSGNEKAVCWIQNARVLQANRKLPKQLFPPNLLGEIVEFYQEQTRTRIFNHSITGSVPCLTRYMSAWASSIDNLTWQRDILFIVAAGNLPLYSRIGFTRLSVREHIVANRQYPDYLLEDSSRIANPAQSFQALTVGSIALNSYHAPPYYSIAQKDKPSAFSCCGLGIWETIKPEVVEYGGDLVIDEGIPPNITFPKDVCPELVRSTLNGGPAIGADKVGTSFAAPKVSNIAARLAAELPNENCLLYRALIVQSARWPEWIVEYGGDKLHILRQIGYGLPDVARALGNAPNRITLMTREERRIVAKQAHIYQVKLPEKLRSQGEAFKILLEVTLSYKAQPRRTRRNRRKYLSTWLDWECSKKGEDPELFKARVLKEFDAPEDAEKGEGLFKWMLGKQNHHGIIKGVSRSAGTLQKDWAVVNSFELTEAFSIAVVGHEGWNNDPEASVPYSLIVSFEAIQADIPIYTPFVEAQVEIEIQPTIEIQSIVVS